MAANINRSKVRLRQLITKFEPCSHNTPISDIELLELYRSFHIHHKIAIEAAVPEPNLRHLTLLCNMCDMIALGQRQLYMKYIHAHSLEVHTASPLQVSSNYEEERLRVSNRAVVTPSHCDKSLPLRVANIHINL